MQYKPISNFISENNLPFRENLNLVSKDFDTWNLLKKNIESQERRIIYKERSIWWCSLGVNIGHEQDGKNDNFERPVLIIHIFNELTCLCIPLTTSPKQNQFHIPIASFSKDTSAIVSQLRLVSTKRLLRELGFINRKDFRLVKDAIHRIIN